MQNSKNSSRQIRALQAAALALVATFSALPAQAQQYPTRPITLVVPLPPGGTNDIMARVIGERLSKSLGQQVVVENRSGGGGNIGANLVAKSEPDGYTLHFGAAGNIAINPSLFKNMPLDPAVDFVPVAPMASSMNVLVVHPSVPAKTLDEFVAFAKANPGKLNCSSTGIGTSSHLSCYILGKRAGLEVTHVPYKGADALRDLLAGRVQFMFATIPSVKQHIEKGNLRALAVSSAQRSRSLPDVPTVAERGFPGFEAGSWFGFFAPKGTPPDVITTLNKHVNEILAVPATEAALVKEGADPVGGTPQQFAQFVQREFEKWRVVVKESGATAE